MHKLHGFDACQCYFFVPSEPSAAQKPSERAILKACLLSLQPNLLILQSVQTVLIICSTILTLKLFTFPKPEHLCLNAEIEQLFASGSNSFSAYPLRAVWRYVDHQQGPKVKVLLSVSKRKLRHAVDRNRAKRQLREAYRLQKHVLLHALAEGRGVHLAFLWLSEKPVDSRVIHQRVGILLERIAEKSAKKIAEKREESNQP